MSDKLVNSKTKSAESRDDKIEELLRKNLELTEEIHKMAKRIDRFVFWQKVLGTLQILIIVVPIILGVIYLPPLLENMLSQYQKLLEAA